MLLLLEINFLHLILPVALLLAGWPPPLPRTHPFHRGEGGWCYDHDHGRGGGGGTRNLEHIYVTCLHCTKQNNIYNHCAQDRIRASNHIPAETYCNCIQFSIFLVWIRLVHEPYISCTVWSIFCSSCSHPKSKKNQHCQKRTCILPHSKLYRPCLL